MLSAHSVRCLVAAAGIAGLGATLTATAAHAAPAAPAFPQNAPVSAPDDAAAPTPDITVTPAPAAAPAAPAAPLATYTVVAGDTLSEIAQAKDIPGNWQALYDINRDQLPRGADWIDIGQVLKLAGVTQDAAPQKPAAAPSAPSTSTTEKTSTRTAPKPSTNTKPQSSSSKLTVDAPAKAPTRSTNQDTSGTTAKTTTTPKTTTQQSTGSTVTAPSSGKAATAIAFAKAQLGKPYVYGAAGPDAYDCSGLVQAAWKAAGVSLPRVTNAQFAAGNKVSVSNLQPGDLVFYYSGISHVGMYLGDGKIIHAPNSRSVVKIVDVDSMPIAGATRPA
ncbi:C40 family peptidase [Streptodolium elevatio]|uniref:LysM peptidoglycan-binding domain-containing C40 family peptidase n=1 Tax=Streptodolium elevatio TaxID=3157996 RepID=A0ABV3DVN5_9ACTN